MGNRKGGNEMHHTMVFVSEKLKPTGFFQGRKLRSKLREYEKRLVKSTNQRDLLITMCSIVLMRTILKHGEYDVVLAWSDISKKFPGISRDIFDKRVAVVAMYCGNHAIADRYATVPA